ncbi:hypothetical protein [Glaciihabitans sp. UYNi722]|uniref:hypothetical protein n=1 Tax=Glaciihabitans sp. UYNi722 TaxID=3156344 RepID=UPI0033926F8C
MTANRGWDRGSNHYQKRIKPSAGLGLPSTHSIALGASGHAADQLALTGITWDPTALDFDLIQEPTPQRVRSRFRAQLPEFIWDAAALEGNPYTLPEVQTLLAGITVTGHKLEDQNQILALNEGYNHVDTLVETGAFSLDKSTSDEIHGLVAVHEAIESGHFRGEGQVGGGGHVSIGERGAYVASDPGERGETLIEEFGDLIDYLDTVEDPRERAIAYFAAATHRQFYFDGNKRTARILMTGTLMSAGYDAISVSANRRLEFNTHLGELFVDHDATNLMRFIIDSRPGE